MGGIANGIAYHGGFIPYVGTFLNFSDYMRGSVRLAALVGPHVIYVWTHDSVGLGEDGPTHQPIEHYAALRAMPNLWFVRPGDPNETSAAWALAVERRDGPVGARAHAPEAADAAGTAERARQGVRRGGYVLVDPAARRAAGARRRRARPHPDRHGLRAAPGDRRGRAHWRPRASARGSSAFRAGSGSGRRTRRTATRSCRRAVRRRLSIEAGASLGWERWVGDEGAILAIDRFGACAPAGTIFEELGFTVDHVADVARARRARRAQRRRAADGGGGRARRVRR